LDSGAALPDDGLHARCSSDGTSRACATGHCDPATQRCVALNGALCSANEACLAQVCGANGRCGYAVGEGPCVADKAETLCQSGVCAQSGVCIASGELRCWANADCAEGSYCDRAEQTCRERIAPGAPVPNDGLHMGCSDGASEACSTGLCSSDTGLCVAANNITCESADACSSGLCGGNGKCGLADGEGPCSEANAAESCQSGKCSPSGDVCMSGDCWFDADCASTEYCERSAQSCAPKLRVGASLPDDGLHDGCEDGRSDTCASGHCADERCVEPTVAAGLSGGGGCSAADAMPDTDASVSLGLLALFLLERRRRRPS
jgi:MYXO-CTERM domain-containing protein